MGFRKCLTAAVLAAAAFSAWAQQPASVGKDLLSLDRIDGRRFDALDLKRIAEEDSLSEGMGQPSRFAIAHESGITPDNAGTWEQAGDLSIWRYRVFAVEAASFNFGFTRFHLPEGASLYVASADQRHVAGPFTAEKNAAHGQLWTPAIPASDVVIELNVPTALRSQVQLELGSINQGYRGFGSYADGYEQPSRISGDGKPCLDGGGRSAACNTDVACLSEGDPWNEPRRAVAALQIGGVLNCTGSLVNNTANDGRMLLATATHCSVTAASAPSVVAFWNYEWPTCRRPGGGDGTQTNAPDPSMSSTGATFLAATRNPFSGCTVPGDCSDFTLVEFNDAPDPKWNLYWAGWDRSTTGAACSNPADPASTDSLCASIHHPRVDEKRITFVDQDLTTANISGAQGVHWFARWDQILPALPNFPAGGALPPSVTEGGSSGSPLYTADQRLVGVLSGGASFCGAAPAQLTDQYGKLAHAWDGLGTAATRVRDYLDPLGTAPMTLDGRGGGGGPDPEPPVPGTIEDGAVERAFGEGGGGTPFNDPTANNSDGPLASAGADIMFKTNWYFRVGGATQETMFAVPDGMTYDASGDRATLFYEGLGGGAFDAELEVTVSEPGANQALQLSNMTITNLGSTPLTIDLFNYSDIDADGSFDADSATNISAGGNIILEVTDAADVVQVGGEGATAFQVNEWATDVKELPQTLENTDVTNLNNSGLPFGPGDFTSTVQWASQSVPGNGSITVQHGIARNTDLVFGGGGGDEPEIDVTPAALSLTAEVDGTDSDDLSITNIGDGTLTWSIDTADVAQGWNGSIGRAGTEVFTRSAGGNVAASVGDLIILGGTQMSQTTNTTIAPANSVACPTGESRAFRRFYFDEHPGVANPAGITSVDVALQEAAESTSLTVNLYTLPAGTAVDTIPLESLTLIGTASVSISAANDGTSINVPVTGNVADTSASDLVVEIASTTRYFIGASDGGQTHPGFLMAPDCGATTPTPIDSLGPDFVNTHIIMVVNTGDGPGPVGCDNPSTIPWLDVGTASGSAAAGQTDLSTITADATGLTAGTYDALLCVASNDSVGNELVEVPVEFIVTGGDDDLIFANGFENDEPAECTPLQLLADPSFEATTGGDAGANPNWSGTDTGGDGSPFYGAAARTGSFGAWGGGWSEATTQTWAQSVTIPSGSPRFLNFWRNVSEVPTGGTATLKASVDGDEVSTFDAIANGLDGDFVSMSVDVSEFADGAEHEISFEYAATGTDDGNVFVDDITLECQAPAANAPAPVRGVATPGLGKRDFAPAVHPSGKRKRG